MLEIGDQAPDFNVLDEKRERFTLSNAVKKEKILLVFYPGDDTPVCTTQLKDYAAHQEEFKNLGVQVYGISISTTESQKAFKEKYSLPFPLLNDYDFRISHKYEVMSFMGVPKRALFLIDENQKILFKHVETLPLFHRSAEELIEKLKSVLPKPKPESTPPPETTTQSVSP